MPVVAIVGAVASVGAGAAALSAGVTGFAALAAGAQIAGGVLAGLGAVSGNKKLTKLGAVLGLAGAVGTAFSGATGGLFNAAKDSQAANAALGLDAVGSAPPTLGALTQQATAPQGLIGNVLQKAATTAPATSASGSFLDSVLLKAKELGQLNKSSDGLLGSTLKGLAEAYARQDALAEAEEARIEAESRRRRSISDSLIGQTRRFV